MNIIIDLKQNKNIYTIPYPITLNGKKGFLLINENRDVVFVNSSFVKKVSDLYDNAWLEGDIPIDPDPVEDKCDSPLVFNLNPTKTIENNLNMFAVSVSGNNGNLVQFKTSIQDWTDSNIGLNSLKIAAPSSGLMETFKARLKGCSEEFSKDFLTSSIEEEEVEEVLVGTINFSTGSYLLIVKKIENLFWLLQTDTDRTFYLPRGINLLDNSLVTVTSVINRETLANETITPLGGLYPSATNTEGIPLNWQTTWWTTNGYHKGEKGWTKETTPVCVDSTWTTNSFTCVNNVKHLNQTSNCGNTRVLVSTELCQNIPVNTGDITFSPETSVLNFINWSNFQEVQVPQGFKNIIGGFNPLSGTDLTGTNGIYKPLVCGVTHHHFVYNLPSDKYDASNIYRWTHPDHLIRQCINQMPDDPAYGDIRNFFNENNYSGITAFGAEQIGLRIAGNMFGELAKRKGFCMFDEEQLPWLGGLGMIGFFGKLVKGMRSVAPELNIGFYAWPLTWFYQVQDQLPKVENSVIEAEMLSTNKISYYIQDFLDAKIFINVLAYVKLPHIKSHNKYKKSGNDFILDSNGKRIWNDVEFTETNYGEVVRFLPSPEAVLKYHIQKGGEHQYGQQYFDNINTEGAAVKESYATQGYTSVGRPKPSQWSPDARNTTRSLYGVANLVMYGLYKLTQSEFNSTDLSIPRDRKLNPYAVYRVLGEGYENIQDERMLNKETLVYETLFTYLSGIEGIEVWGQPRFNNGQSVPLNYQIVQHQQEATNRLFRDLEGSNKANWRYIHFYYPSVIQNIDGVVSSGIYTGNKFVFIVANPSLNFDETQSITVSINNVDYAVSLVGSQLYKYGVITNLPSNLTPDHFKLKYTTIYNRYTEVVGKVTGLINNTLLV